MKNTTPKKASPKAKAASPDKAIAPTADATPELTAQYILDQITHLNAERAYLLQQAQKLQADTQAQLLKMNDDTQAKYGAIQVLEQILNLMGAKAE